MNACSFENFKISLIFKYKNFVRIYENYPFLKFWIFRKTRKSENSNICRTSEVLEILKFFKICIMLKMLKCGVFKVTKIKNTFTF
jgi:hypothetical protein